MSQYLMKSNISVVMESKPSTRHVPPKTVCDIQKFDAVSVRKDYRNYFHADFIKVS